MVMAPGNGFTEQEINVASIYTNKLMEKILPVQTRDHEYIPIANY
jgi:hypothetical protein